MCTVRSQLRPSGEAVDKRMWTLEQVGERNQRRKRYIFVHTHNCWQGLECSNTIHEKWFSYSCTCILYVHVENYTSIATLCMYMCIHVYYTVVRGQCYFAPFRVLIPLCTNFPCRNTERRVCRSPSPVPCH